MTWRTPATPPFMLDSANAPTAVRANVRKGRANHLISVLSLERASSMFSGLLVNVWFALSTFSDESLGLFANHGISLQETGFRKI